MLWKLHAYRQTIGTSARAILEKCTRWRFPNIFGSAASSTYVEDAQFLGFDFRISQDTKQWMLLEANPMPGFDFYDRLSEGKISALLAGLLSGESAPVPKLDYARRSGIGVIGEERLPSVAN